MHGAIFLLLYRRGGRLAGADDAGARAYCVVAMDSYTAGALVAQAFHAGAVREQAYHAGAAVAGKFHPGCATEQTYHAGAIVAGDC